MNVIVLHGEMNDAKDVSQSKRRVRLRDAPTHLAGDRLRAKGWKPRSRAERDVHRMRSTMPLPLPMRNILAPQRTRAPSAVPPPTPFVKLQLELAHLN